MSGWTTPTYDDFWQSRSIERRHDQIRVPALNIAGWYDIFLEGSIRNFTGVKQQGATQEARTGSRLLLGPWTHTTPPLAESGAVDFGARAGQSLMPLSMDVDGLTLRFFDRWLKGIDDGYDDEPPVRLFVMGEDVWRSENEWPLARAAIGLEVSSSNFPRFDRNLNTGHELGADAEMLPALQTIFHDREHPSRLVLPIVPR